MPADRSDAASPFGSRKPRYVALAEEISRAIGGGTYPVGTLLPSEAELCASYRVSRHTVREATRMLQNFGLVSRHQGLGTRILSRKIAARYVLALDAIPDLWEYAKTTKLKVVRKRIVKAKDADTALPGPDPEHGWWLVEALRYGKAAEPLAWSQLYFDSIYGEISGQVGKRRAPVYALIESRYGVKVVRVQQDISALPIPAAVARSLRVKPASPGIMILRHYFDAADRVFEVTSSIYPADCFRYSVELRLEYGNDKRK